MAQFIPEEERNSNCSKGKGVNPDGSLTTWDDVNRNEITPVITSVPWTNSSQTLGLGVNPDGTVCMEFNTFESDRLVD